MLKFRFFYIRVLILVLMTFIGGGKAFGGLDEKAKANLSTDLIDAEYYILLNKSKDRPGAASKSKTIKPLKIETEKFNGTGYYLKTNLWKSGIHGARLGTDGITIEIPVCWYEPNLKNKDHSEGRKITKEAVQLTWEAKSSFKFVGWGHCNVRRPGGIRIKVDESSPNSFIGVSGYFNNKNAQITMWLNFDFNNWSRPCRKVDNLRDWETCVFSIAVHEFGHALGLEHEHNRLFYSSTFHELTNSDLEKLKRACAEKNVFGSTKLQPDQLVIKTTYDPKSVMNYCHDIYSEKVTLSDFDIMIIQSMR